ncbi:MarR family winged helix-turn-helix transcriptional regulator [Rhodococcus tukisamuensis]|uniref:MarR family protein n=1 Tax=Rhodococcus tukisamuensis TaxID=168276 RepID=A0A1G6MG25_9NOCA|nr:MarR family transcriptional regulator [Rhodococcus tukisamuensis]SDC54391.1 MarR family protein [Rhodococcus tukisamuensis]
MSERESPGYELPLLLFSGFRSLIDETHRRLAAQGHPEMRPAHGFAMQAIGVEGASASEVGRRLGVSKQAAGKTVDRLEAMGYVSRQPDPSDARAKTVVLTERGLDSLRRSAVIFEELQSEWAAAIGTDRLRALESDLRTVTGGQGLRLDAQAWFGG